jgi:hypothetical protein
MFRLAVSLIGFIANAAMHPAIADPALAAPPVAAHYAPVSEQVAPVPDVKSMEQPVRAQVPVLKVNAPVGAGWG